MDRKAESTSTKRADAISIRQGWGDLILSAAWFGLLTGWVEIAVKATQRIGLGRLIHASRDVYWMAPLAGLLLYTAIGLVMGLPARRGSPVVGRRWAIFFLAFAALLNLLFLLPQLHHYSSVLLALGGGWQVSRLMEPRFERFRGWMVRLNWIMLLGVALTALFARGWQSMAERQGVAALAPPEQGPNVLLIVLDTVRAANLSLYGYGRETTPYLKRMSRSGVVFERAISPAPWTLPSHASFFTGRHPHEMSANWHTPLDRNDPTLAEFLSRRGYLTGGFVANTVYCNHEQGIDRGFISYRDYPLSFGQLMDSLTLVNIAGNHNRLRGLIRSDELLNRQSAEEINRKFLSWLPARSDRPFFAFLNYFDAHEPYLPPPPFDRKFGPGRKSRYNTPLYHVDWVNAANRRLPEWAHQEEIDAYDGAIAYLDRQLEALFEELRRQGLFDRTAIIITSDHGEEFSEHGLYSHGKSLYWPSVHVPLLIHYPAGGTAGQRISQPVTTRDLPATIMALLGLPSRFPGQSLTGLWSGESPGKPTAAGPILSGVRQLDNVVKWFPNVQGDLYSLTGDSHRYLRNGDGSEELYRYVDDPWETENLAGRPESLPLLEEFRAQMKTILRSRAVAAAGASP